MRIHRARDAEAEQYRLMQLLYCSRTLYAKVGFKMHVNVNNNLYHMHFPTTVAQYNQSRDDEQSSQDARLIVNTVVVTKREHIPSFDKMKDIGDTWLELNKHRLIESANIIAHEARPFVHDIVVEGKLCNILLEAQLSSPLFFTDTTRFNFVIRETRGPLTNLSTMVTGKELIMAMNRIFQQRRRVLASIQDELSRLGAALYPHSLISFRNHPPTPH